MHVKMHLPGNNEYGEILEKLEREITPEEVYREEEKTQHNLRALVNVIKSRVPSSISSYVHLGATSVDILDTAQALRMRDAVRKVILPLLTDLLEELAVLSEREAETPQVGRTHGQHAVPVTLGFSFAEFVARLGKSIVELEKLSADLRGSLPVLSAPTTLQAFL